MERSGGARRSQGALELTAEQRRAVASDAHALEIRAGAGTGKTTTLAHRIARFAREGVAEHRLLAVTFTRDATAALTRKLGILLGKGHGVRVSSFHQWAARALAGDEPRYLDQEEARRLVLRHLQRAPQPLAFSLALGAGEDVAARVLGFLSYARNAETSVGGAIERQFPALAPWQGVLEELADAYEEAKGERLDYDDLLLLFRDRIAKSGTFRREIVQGLDHLAVDEYQDVNRAQADIVRGLTAPRGGVAVTVVGDPRQSIYGFRGASPAELDRFLDAYGKRGARIALTASFRSTRAIVAAGNALLPDAYPLRSRPRAPAGVDVAIDGFDDLAQEARAVADHLVRLLEAGSQPEDCAVLVRARGLAARYVEEARERSGLHEVRVSTIHAAKGLEWDHVVVMGAREGGLPSFHALRAGPGALPALLAEERRLLYVAATRARKSLKVTWAGTRSRFLAPLDATLPAPPLRQKKIKKSLPADGRTSAKA